VQGDWSARADGALYAAKQRGRNGTVVHRAIDAPAVELPAPVSAAG
jgi:hypothetical protein